MRDFKKYDIWQLSHELTLKTYQLTKSFPKEELYGLTSQIRRSVSSIPTNISEGCGRNSDAEFNQFLNIALGSAKDLKYIEIEIFEKIGAEINIIKSKTFKLKSILTSKQ
jgi:four helix bundle protein